jgi:hypothetical protein
MRFCLGAVAIRRDYKRSTGAKDTELPHETELEAAITATNEASLGQLKSALAARNFVNWCNANIWG